MFPDDQLQRRKASWDPCKISHPQVSSLTSFRKTSFQKWVQPRNLAQSLRMFSQIVGNVFGDQSYISEKILSSEKITE